MKLILMRHMKSSWDGNTSDHERPLNPRGRAAAPRLGEWLVGCGHVPDVALVSDATRTRETYAGVEPEFTNAMSVIFTRALYLASPAEILRVIAAHPVEPGQTLLIIGHNPGIAELASGLAQEAPAHDQFGRYPTGATTVLQFTQEIKPRSGIVLDFAVPREL
ncbi:histidine phosphatase family protein [Falsihalocynthiibacter sp. SS001]|uniref:SixA phosphatase family protein n=1 Tax=Falsihalocynthiibacter sp. SS001 TaxID=3349698 RepID=UPI0036D3062B